MKPMRHIRCAQPQFGDIPAILADFEKILRSGRLMMGDYTRRLEADFARYLGVKHAVSVSCCTAALEIVLRYLRLDGGEVIVPANTFVATANAVVYAGGKPVFADVGPEQQFCLTAAELDRRLTPKTRAVVLVHLGGFISEDIAAVRARCHERNIALLEDCAHAHGASRAGRKAGSFGLAGAFSFYPTKIMTTATGGMVTTDDDALADFARSLRLHGRGEGARGGLDAIVNLGNDWFLDELRAALGVHQLAGLEAAVAARRERAARYDRALSGGALSPVSCDAACLPSYYKYMAMLPEGVSKADFCHAMQEKHGVEMESLYDPPVHLQPVYQERFGTRAGMMPRAEAGIARQVCLPVHPGVTLDDVDYVAARAAEELKMLKAVGA